jgi:hypothetical protein
MLHSDEIKQKVETKFNELGDMCERGEMEPEQAYEMFKEFEDKMVAECTELIESKMPTDADELTESGGKKVELDDLPGEGPVLRWESRIVFVPSGDAYHPKNRKVKLSVTVKELGLSRHAFRRLREVVGKRYNSGKDELTIISERYDEFAFHTLSLKIIRLASITKIAQKNIILIVIGSFFLVLILLFYSLRVHFQNYCGSAPY